MDTRAILLLLVLLAGCTRFPVGTRGGPVQTPSFEEVLEEFDSNGELIYYTGYNVEGQRIESSGGPMWFYMHGGACVTCHGVEAKGGSIPHMCAEVAPSITWHALTEEEHEEADAHEEPHPPYTEETIKEAVTKGVEPNGEHLDPCMPRWDMEDADLDDLIMYLKTLE